MASGPRQPEPPEERPKYTRYRARPAFLARFDKGSALDALRRRDPRSPRRPGDDGPRRDRRTRGPAGPVTWGRVAKWVALGSAGWIGLSIVLFLVSAQIESGKISGDVDRYLS